MIARIWRGAARREDGHAYARYMQTTGIAGYARTPGNRAAFMLRRDVGDRFKFVMVSLWDSMAAVAAFAGPEPERAVFYPEDDRFLVERDLTVEHYQVDTAVLYPAIATAAPPRGRARPSGHPHRRPLADPRAARVRWRRAPGHPAKVEPAVESWSAGPLVVVSSRHPRR
jgi:heme-degrading monooxygenase HmoA